MCRVSCLQLQKKIQSIPPEENESLESQLKLNERITHIINKVKAVSHEGALHPLRHNHCVWINQLHEPDLERATKVLAMRAIQHAARCKHTNAALISNGALQGLLFYAIPSIVSIYAARTHR